MKQTRDSPCDKVVTSKNVAFSALNSPFLPLFPRTFFDDLFLDIPLIFLPSLEIFLPPSISFSLP